MKRNDSPCMNQCLNASIPADEYYQTIKIFKGQFSRMSVKEFLNIQFQRYFSRRSEETKEENSLIQVLPEQT